jgi:hypothetical protein
MALHVVRGLVVIVIDQQVGRCVRPIIVGRLIFVAAIILRLRRRGIDQSIDFALSGLNRHFEFMG